MVATTVVPVTACVGDVYHLPLFSSALYIFGCWSTSGLSVFLAESARLGRLLAIYLVGSNIVPLHDEWGTWRGPEASGGRCLSETDRPWAWLGLFRDVLCRFRFAFVDRDVRSVVVVEGAGVYR